MNDIMQQLLEAQRRAQEKEERHREEIKQLQTTVTTLVLDIKSLQEAAPNWGYSSGSTTVKPGSSENASQVAQNISILRSFRAVKSTAVTPNIYGYTGTQLRTRTKNRIIAAIRSNEGLDTVVLNQFMIRHTNKDVHLAYFKIDKEAEKVARAHVDEWIPMFLEGARLIESTWYPIKVDFIPKIEAADHHTGAISQETRDAFAEENEVEVKLMRWLGRPKEHAAYASAVAKLATKEQVERLLQRQADGEEVQLFGCMVTVSTFHDNRGPRACYNCHQFGHPQKEFTQQAIRNAQSTGNNKKERSTYVAMISTLNILQANLHRSSGVQDALYNDSDIWDFDAILIQEPHYWEIAGNTQITGAGPNFEVIKPKTLQRENQTQRIRSCMWINRNNEYTQLTINSNDITAIVMRHGIRSILLVSIYIPCIGNGQEVDTQELHTRLQEVQEAITGEGDCNAELEVFIAGDFNRHDTIWGGNEVALGMRQGEGSRILDFIEENNLQLLTQRGVPTWERNGSTSTIDLTMVSERLFEDRDICHLFENEYGSDHRAIHTAINMGDTIEDPTTPRYLLQKADWKAIRDKIGQHLTDNSFPTDDLEAMQGYIQGSIKVLGVIMDQGLRFKEHLAEKAGKALKAALALKRLQGLNPSTMRQLFTATVAPVMDYASPIWYLAVSDKTLAVLHRAQRVAAQAIVGGFRTLGLDVAVLEAGIPSLRQRLHEQTLRFWISIQKLEASHIHAKLAKTKPIKRFNSPLRKTAALFKELHANRADKIPAIGCEPWSPKAHIYILDKEAAKLATSEEPGTIDFYTDGSVRNGRAGVGIWTSAWEASRTTRRAEETNVHLTELEAIWMAIKGIPQGNNRSVKIRVFSDSQSALRSIQSAKINDSIGLVMKIREKIARATFSLHWVPGHEGIRGNERANELAQKATEVTSSMPDPTDKVPISAIYARAKAMEFKPESQEFYGATTGKHLQKIDKALPGKHTIRLYNALNRTAAAILVQLRTNISRLNTYLSKINAADTDKCECGMTETVSHFLFLCPRWRNERQEMRSAHGSRYCDLSYALGGYSIHEENGKKVDGEKDRWQPDVNAVKATIEFAKATGRLQRQT
ncbi:unnamed protein product [Aureobasidium pullulans]|nr:unnamed protein product [Aureobasidium pullulans]